MGAPTKGPARAKAAQKPWEVEETRPPLIFFALLAFQGLVAFLMLRHFGFINFI